jgi:arylsulfatase A-like enzyme
MRTSSAGTASLLVLALAPLMAFLPVACDPGPGLGEGPPPDVLLITVDTLRADHLGSYGFSHDTSPRIDALAAEGVLFERAIAASSRTVPSHASIMTSRYPREHSVGHLNGKSTLRDATTLAEHFRAAGYATAGFIGNILLTHTTGLGVGFDLFDDEIETPELNRADVVERLATDTTERAVRWLDEPREGPVFLWVHYQDPHGPFTPPPEDENRFEIEPRPGERPLPLGKSNQGPGGVPPYQVLPGLSLPSEYEGRYAGEIFYADREIGKLLAAFDLLSNAQGVVLLTADHGESLGEAGRYYMHGHASTPDVAHVPLILRAPGIAPSRRSEVVGHVDILPTLLDLAGLPVPEEARGVALGPVLRGDDTLPDRLVYCDNGARVSAYDEGGFVRVHGLAGAWQGPLANRGRRWHRFSWPPGRAWELEERGLGEISAEIFGYVGTAQPMEHLPPPDPELVDQLRALGYVDGPSAEPPAEPEVEAAAEPDSAD